MKGYSRDLRLKVLAAVDLGMPRKEVVRTYGVSMPTLERYLSLRRRTGEIGPPRPPGRMPSISATIEGRSGLWRQLEENDSATLERHCELWESKQGERVSIPTMWRAVRKLGWTKKSGRWEPPSETMRTEMLSEGTGGFSIRVRKS
jgi:transposase